MGGATATFWLALLIVSAATVALIATDPRDFSEWPRIAVSIKPAWVLVYGLGGGPHSDVSGKWWYQGPVTFVVALAMWWAVLEGCRRLWKWKREIPWVVR